MKNKNEIADYLRELADRIENASWVEVDNLEVETIDTKIDKKISRVKTLTLKWKEEIP